jgi:hypothetical protein
VRTREQVDETLTDKTGPNNTENWKYFLGCYKGETAVTEDDAGDIDFTEACVDRKSVQILGISSSSTANAAPAAAGNSSTKSSSESAEHGFFPADATVLLESGESRRMDEVS